MSVSKLSVLLLVLSAVAATLLQPSEARVQGGLKPTAAGDQEEAEPSTTIPGLPTAPPSPGLPTLPPMLGLIPGLPGSPPPPPPPKECLTPLMSMIPCMDYLTNITVPAPQGACCDGLKSVIGATPICLCHGMNGGMSSLVPQLHIDPIRMLILPLRCGTMLPLQTLFSCFTQPLPPLMPPSSPPATAASSPVPAPPTDSSP